jgi:hypothetical protein
MLRHLNRGVEFMTKLASRAAIFAVLAMTATAASPPARAYPLLTAATLDEACRNPQVLGDVPGACTYYLRALMDDDAMAPRGGPRYCVPASTPTKQVVDAYLRYFAGMNVSGSPFNAPSGGQPKLTGASPAAVVARTALAAAYPC